MTGESAAATLALQTRLQSLARRIVDAARIAAAAHASADRPAPATRLPDEYFDGSEPSQTLTRHAARDGAD